MLDFDFVSLINNLVNWLLTSGVRIVIIAAGAYVVIKLGYILIGKVEKKLIEKGKERLEVARAMEREQRVGTLGSILRKILSVIIVAIAVVMILREIGMDITPIITGAGIAGLAIGFGAQNLVRDIISGFFIILENQVSVGDVAIINGTGGLVEEINLRTIVLRDLQGTVHVFPNGTINTLSNMTKEWSRYVIDVGVAYKEDIDKVMEVLKEIGDELMNDEKFKPLILEPLEILGVDNFGSSEVTIKIMIKTLPLKQWDVGRELRRRIKKTFDEKNIEIPFPHLSVYFGEASKPFSIALGDGGKEARLSEEEYGFLKKLAQKSNKPVEEVLRDLERMYEGDQQKGQAQSERQ